MSGHLEICFVFVLSLFTIKYDEQGSALSPFKLLSV